MGLLGTGNMPETFSQPFEQTTRQEIVQNDRAKYLCEMKKSAETK